VIDQKKDTISQLCERLGEIGKNEEEKKEFFECLRAAAECVAKGTSVIEGSPRLKVLLLFGLATDNRVFVNYMLPLMDPFDVTNDEALKLFVDDLIKLTNFPNETSESELSGES